MYTINRINGTNYTDLQYLFNVSFGNAPTLNELRNKYDTACFGEENVGLLAKDGSGDLAAYYGVFPAVLDYNGELVLVAQSGDTMTAPLHQKKGLFIQLAKKTYELCEQLSIKIVFGFPNSNSYPGFARKLNWDFSGNMKRFCIKTLTFPVAELSFKNKKLRKIYRSWYRGRLAKYHISLDKVSSEIFKSDETKAIIKRSTAFFRYKLRNPNTVLIKKNGFVMLLKVSNALNVGCVSYFEESEMPYFTKTVKSIARSIGCRIIAIDVSENHWLHSYLKEVPFSEGSPIGFYCMDDKFDIHNIQFSMADYDSF